MTKSTQQKNRAKSSLKKFTIGFEVEFFVIDHEGKIAPGAPAILKKIAETSTGPNAIIPECADNLIEVGSYPDTEGTNTMKSLLEGLRLSLSPSSKLFIVF